MRAQDKVNNNNKNAKSHETSEEMVRDLLTYIPYVYTDVVMDAGSGKNKVWYNCVNVAKKYEMELSEGKDYLNFDGEVDWTIGNPPYHIGWMFHEKALQTSRKGIAWLANINNVNSLLSPRRLEISKNYGFGLTKMVVIEDKRWFGRYFFLVFEKQKDGEFNSIIQWKNKKY